MGQVIVRNLDDDVIDRLRARAVRNGHSLEQELRNVLAAAVRHSDHLAEELARIRSLTPPGPRPLAEDLIREGREER